MKRVKAVNQQEFVHALTGHLKTEANYECLNWPAV